jgi:hypothetical protein
MGPEMMQATHIAVLTHYLDKQHRNAPVVENRFVNWLLRRIINPPRLSAAVPMFPVRRRRIARP